MSVKSVFLRPMLVGAASSVTSVSARATEGGGQGMVHVPGPDPRRILIAGNGPNIGIGVLSHELGLPGQLGRKISALTGRGTDLEVMTRVRLPLNVLDRLLGEIDLRRFDALVLTIGYSEAVRLSSPVRWRRELSVLLDRIAAATGAGLHSFVLAARPFVPNPDFPAMMAHPANKHMQLLNSISREVLAGRGLATFVERLPEVSVSFFEHTARSYEQWAEALAPEIVPLLGSARRNDPAPDERSRQDALDELGILDTGPQERFDRHTRLAVDLFGMRGAAVTFIDREREWCKSVAGMDAPEHTARSEAFCNVTIGSPDMLIVEDARADPRFRHLPAVQGPGGVRFYAGYPLEGRNGHRVGAFCVVDTKPHSFSRADRALLRDLALKVQADLRSLAETA